MTNWEELFTKNREEYTRKDKNTTLHVKLAVLSLALRSARRKFILVPITLFASFSRRGLGRRIEGLSLHTAAEPAVLEAVKT